jgi:hypothetical protein
MAGGRLADRGVMRALALTLLALLAVLVASQWAFGHAPAAMAYVVVLGVAAFATVAPMQMRVLQQAGEAGANLASSLNIAAFNLGNALGAWVGGWVIACPPAQPMRTALPMARPARRRRRRDGSVRMPGGGYMPVLVQVMTRTGAYPSKVFHEQAQQARQQQRACERDVPVALEQPKAEVARQSPQPQLAQPGRDAVDEHQRQEHDDDPADHAVPPWGGSAAGWRWGGKGGAMVTMTGSRWRG